MTEALAEPTAIPAGAGFWIRAAARAVDWLLVLIAQGTGILMFIFAATFFRSLRGQGHADVVQAAGQNLPVQWIAGVVSLVVYHAIAEGVLGTTLGKRLFGLRVVSDAIGRASFRQAVVRNLGFFVDSLFFGIIAAQTMRESPARQRLGDRWAHTRVIPQRSLEGYPWPSGTVFTFVILGAFLAAAEGSALGEYLVFLGRGQ
jgi:uncharacterized RDD family membrane protein YckC